ncbi:hypothetical protein DPMN_135781 [Dreissena polymorpha]|uniref:Uncharacterized protein n=1 Tax=Dreissena polymorpha TaxID=45954 RepID=A0A9D4JD81_DREPO|nr:hypothetical protein DPMN_135781 [Dreissena polymorpha]
MGSVTSHVATEQRLGPDSVTAQNLRMEERIARVLHKTMGNAFSTDVQPMVLGARGMNGVRAVSRAERV